MQQDNSSFWQEMNCCCSAPVQPERSICWTKMGLNARYLPAHRTAAIYFASDLSTVISHGGANRCKTGRRKKKKDWKTYLELICYSNSSVCICGCPLLPRQHRMWVFFFYPYLSQLTLLLSFPFFLVLIVSSRETERNYRESVSSLATALCSALTLGDMTGFFIGLPSIIHTHTHTYSCYWTSLNCHS